MTWRERIAMARERGEFSWEDRFDACSWNTCAVGEQVAAYPGLVRITMVGGERIPLDSGLTHFGAGNHLDSFTAAVRNNDFNRADDCLDKIEDYILQLKRNYTTKETA